MGPPLGGLWSWPKLPPVGAASWGKAVAPPGSADDAAASGCGASSSLRPCVRTPGGTKDPGGLESTKEAGATGRGASPFLSLTGSVSSIVELLDVTPGNGDVVEKFNEVNALKLIARAHQLVMEGYKPLFDETLVTVWSAPNYCYRCGNVAAILELDGELARTYRIFEAAPQESRGVPQKSPAPEYFL